MVKTAALLVEKKSRQWQVLLTFPPRPWECLKTSPWFSLLPFQFPFCLKELSVF